MFSLQRENKMGDFSENRRNYDSTGLEIEKLNEDPFIEFDKWFKQALEIEKFEPNAMALATASYDGKPSVRYVLLKKYDQRGFVFYTNYNSKKSKHIHLNPHGSFVFYWPILQQQIRVEGTIEKLSDKESDLYFDSRPYGSKIGAWASPQSDPIPSRDYLEELKNEFQKEYSKKKIVRPEYWGGYRIIPNIIEFWQGREDRLHDRFEYSLFDKKGWKIQRLAP